MTDKTPKQLSQDMQFRILRLLEQNPHLSQRALADTLGVSLGRLNYGLRALLQKGLVKFSNFTAASDKRRYAYILTPKGIAHKAALTSGFLQRKMAEYDALKREIAVLEAEAGLAGRQRKDPDMTTAHEDRA